MSEFIACVNCDCEDFWNLGGFLRCQGCYCDQKPGYKREYLGIPKVGGGLNQWGKWQRLKGKKVKYDDKPVPFRNGVYL